jgi:hypothetical protein
MGFTPNAHASQSTPTLRHPLGASIGLCSTAPPSACTIWPLPHGDFAVVLGFAGKP